MVALGLALPQLGPHVDAGTVQEFATRAEALGYVRLWAQERHLVPLGPGADYAGVPGAAVPTQYQQALTPTELLAAVAAMTTTIRLATGVLVAGLHRPLELAKRLTTIDVLSGGRLDVGLGVGWSAAEHRAAGARLDERGPRVDELLDGLLAAWGPDPVQWQGTFAEIPLSLVGPKPLQSPHPPLISGMWSAPGLRRTAARYDGWNPAGMSVARVARIVEELNASRPAGRAPLTVHYRVFLEQPIQRPGQPPLSDERLAEIVAQADEAGFDEVVIDASFWSEIRSPADWSALPDRFAPLI
jgi:probable F420-dependent oxidoreductase